MIYYSSECRALRDACRAGLVRHGNAGVRKEVPCFVSAVSFGLVSWVFEIFGEETVPVVSTFGCLVWFPLPSCRVSSIFPPSSKTGGQ